MTAEKIKERLEALERLRLDTIANANALNGAIEDCKWWLAQLEEDAGKDGKPKLVE